MNQPQTAIGPLSLLAACLVPVVGAFAINDATQGGLCLLAAIILLGWLATDLRSTAFRLSLGLIAALSITLTTWLYGGRDLDEALGAACRILYIVLPSALLTPRIRPSELGDHLAQRLHLPHRGVVAAVVALQRLDSLADQWRQVQRARRARGLGLDGGPVHRLRESAASAFSLLVVSMRQTGSTSMAMDARGFATARERSWGQPAPWHLADTVVLTLAGVLAALPWLLR